MDKKNIIIIILSVLLVSVIVLIFALPNNSSETKTPTNDETNNNQKIEGYKSFNEIDISECSHRECDKTYEFNKSTLRIVSTSNLNYQIIYNKKIIKSSYEIPYLGNKIYAYDDKIVYSLYSDSESFNVFVYDPNDLEFQSFNLDPEDINWKIKDAQFSENKIVFNTSRFINGDNFGDVAAHAMVPITNCENYTKYKDYDAAKTFEITYSNGKFSDAVNTKTEKLKDYKNYSKLCN